MFPKDLYVHKFQRIYVVKMLHENGKLKYFRVKLGVEIDVTAKKDFKTVLKR